MSKNSTLRALFVAIQKGDLGAALPLADHLEELGAPDLATYVREAIARDGWELVEAVAEVFVECHANKGRDLLRWEDEPYCRRTLALHRTMLALSLDDVPILTDAIDLDDRPAWVRQARSLFRRLKLHGIEVDPRAYGGSDPRRGSSPNILVYVPHREEVYLEDPDLCRKLLDEGGREGKRVLNKLGNILARAFPSLGASCWPERLDDPSVCSSVGGSRRQFMFFWYEPNRWRIPRRRWPRWSSPELALWRPPEADEAEEVVR
jgi:hypothetical protein